MIPLEEKKRKTRRDKGIRLLTPRDVWVLRWIAEMYAIRFDQLRQLLSRQPLPRNKLCVPAETGLSNSDVLQILGRWTREPAWAVYKRIYQGQPGWIWMTPYGIEIVHAYAPSSLPKYARHTLRESRLTHRYYVNQVRLNYEQRHPEALWVSERTLLTRLPRRRLGEDLPHIPDAEIWLRSGKGIAVEVELSPKADGEIDSILAELLARYQAIWYFVSLANPISSQACRVVEQAHNRLPTQARARMQIIDVERLERGGTNETTTSTTFLDENIHRF